jgi:hypothetical protein
MTNGIRINRSNKRHFALAPVAPSPAPSPPERPATKRSAVWPGLARHGTCVSGWVRVVPQESSGGRALGRATWEGEWGNVQQVLSQRDNSRAVARAPRSRGSSTSRRVSPSRLNPSTARKMARPGKIPAHGSWVTCPWAAAVSMPPQLGTSGGTPTPRKLRDASRAGLGGLPERYPLAQQGLAFWTKLRLTPLAIEVAKGSWAPLGSPPRCRSPMRHLH